MRGMSLAEVIFSGVLALLLCLAILSAFPTSLWAVSQSENLIQADQLAQSALDEVQARPFAELTPGPVELAPVRIAGLDFTRRLEVFEVPGSRADLIKGLRMTIYWEERGRPREAVHELWVSGLPRS